MAKFWIDYARSVLIEADSAEDAKEKFWNDNYEELGTTDIRICLIEEEVD